MHSQREQKLQIGAIFTEGETPELSTDDNQYCTKSAKLRSMGLGKARWQFDQ